MRIAVASLLLLTAVLAGGCGGDSGPTVNGTTAPAGTSLAATATATATAIAAPVASAECSPTNLEGCVYPSRNLTYVTREGLSTQDPVTGRTLPLLARLPTGIASPAPVVIWMHGGGFNDNGHRESNAWGDTLARHGYVVIHVASSSLTIEAGRTMCELAKVPLNECTPAEEDDNGLLMVFRGFDLHAVLNDLPRLSTVSVNNGGPALDLKRVAVGGWSGGSRGPMLVMGTQVQPSANAPVYSNPHPLPAAAFVMSPAGPEYGGMFDVNGTTSWDQMQGPFFMATGTNDVKPDKRDLTGDIRRFLFKAQPSDRTRWMLYSDLPVGVGGHGTYNLDDLNSSDERVRRLSLAISSSVRAFLDASLSDDAAARTWLATSDARVLAGEAEWLHR